MKTTNPETVKMSRELMMEIHKVTVQLSKILLFENGLPLRSSLETIAPSLNETFPSRHYSYEFIKFLAYSQIRDQDNISRIETLFERGMLTDENVCQALQVKLDSLVRMVNGFKHAERGRSVNSQ